MIDYELIKKLFGSKDEKDFSKVVLQVSISLPSISAKDLLQIFRITLENYYSKSDEIIDFTTWTNQQYSGRNMLDISENPSDPKENLFSTYVYRNLHRMLRKSDVFDEALKKKTFLSGLERMRDKIVRELKKNYRNTELLDKFEVLCEFIELVQKKVAKINQA